MQQRSSLWSPSKQGARGNRGEYAHNRGNIQDLSFSRRTPPSLDEHLEGSRERRRTPIGSSSEISAPKSITFSSETRKNIEERRKALEEEIERLTKLVSPSKHKSPSKIRSEKSSPRSPKVKSLHSEREHESYFAGQGKTRGSELLTPSSSRHSTPVKSVESPRKDRFSNSSYDEEDFLRSTSDINRRKGGMEQDRILERTPEKKRPIKASEEEEEEIPKISSQKPSPSPRTSRLIEVQPRQEKYISNSSPNYIKSKDGELVEQQQRQQEETTTTTDTPRRRLISSSQNLLTKFHHLAEEDEAATNEWLKVADLLDLSGFDGTEFRQQKNKGKMDAKTVERTIKIILRDFQRQRIIIEKSMDATKREDAFRKEVGRKLQQKDAEIKNLDTKVKQLEFARRSEPDKLPIVKNKSEEEDHSKQLLKLYEMRTKKLQEELSNCRNQLDNELQLAAEVRREAREEYQRIFGSEGENTNNHRIIQILQGFLQERRRGVNKRLLPSSDDQLEITPLHTDRDTKEILDFSKRICELVTANSTDEPPDQGEEEYVDKIGDFPTSTFSRVIPTISQWISQAHEAEKLKKWKSQIMLELQSTSEEDTLHKLRKLLISKPTEVVNKELEL